MITRFKSLGKSGAAAMEFAYIVPIWVVMIFSFINVGIYFFAAAGLKHSIDEASRYATIWPTPTDAQLVQRIDTTRFGFDPARLTVQPLVRGASQGSNYVDITLSYQTSLNFLVVSIPAITITERRRAYRSLSAI